MAEIFSITTGKKIDKEIPFMEYLCPDCGQNILNAKNTTFDGHFHIINGFEEFVENDIVRNWYQTTRWNKKENKSGS